MHSINLNIVLVSPDIPQNTGNIGRLCVGLNAHLHLVHPMGFVLDDKKIKRAGLDYWQDLKLSEHASWESFLETTKASRLFFFTTKTDRLYSEMKYQDGDFLVFGSESKGLPEAIRNEYAETCVTLPMPGNVRSLNLSNSAAIAAYEAYRQITNVS